MAKLHVSVALAVVVCFVQVFPSARSLSSALGSFAAKMILGLSLVEVAAD